MGFMKCMQEGCTVDSYALYPLIAGFDGFCKKSIRERYFVTEQAMPAATPTSPVKSIFSITSRLNRNLPFLQRQTLKTCYHDAPDSQSDSNAGLIYQQTP
jgi:hypothetical protein